MRSLILPLFLVFVSSIYQCATLSLEVDIHLNAHCEFKQDHIEALLGLPDTTVLFHHLEDQGWIYSFDHALGSGVEYLYSEESREGAKVAYKITAWAPMNGVTGDPTGFECCAGETNVVVLLSLVEPRLVEVKTGRWASASCNPDTEPSNCFARGYRGTICTVDDDRTSVDYFVVDEDEDDEQ
ncbi:uncharacterized protein L969DRAFT_50440 [Mixia osmundae IAM 14324]|uniref:Uncharacterized protein n=1 Tax=Mixia osmundae (strain CBS 9802 / IAM 14324 / JCM 22182 / KY 12970) TaxID=764103 RepID=G7E105_MIXOS|nr:uncharacterized protein L969DRAFT_50440 [Mixia osmundae IAM 14324]KEI38850.1 hypothetical protein L969DRAFT_50440 [Mixia osmundae IAM 14324]GAA96515.1 hypothetical protein E5Q_03183 [Mixia osmundae IAM 14324]